MAEIARVIKANSSGWVRAKWSSDFAWQIGYGVFSVSESNVGAVTKYVASQEEHQKSIFEASFCRPFGACRFALPPTAGAVGCILTPLRLPAGFSLARILFDFGQFRVTRVT
jgi:hypothetical protein